MSFKNFLQITASDIDSELELFFQKWSKDVEQISPRLLPLIDALADACRGGKRVRGALISLGYELGLNSNGIASSSHFAKLRGTPRNDNILRAAVAYEIFQAAILAHDDIIDKSLLRRGKPSLYSRLGGGHAGISKAICLGDIGFFLAFQLMAKTKFSDEAKNRALAVFSKTMLETGIGELLDVELSKIPPNPPLIKGDKGGFLYDDIITVYKYKTAYYTITGPLLIGSILGRAEDDRQDAIKIFGRNLGIGFQIQDDINDIFSDRTHLGKEVGGDIRTGKQTLLYIYASEHADGQQKKILEKYYGNPMIGRAEIEEVKKIFEESGALEYASGEAGRYAERARKSINKITKSDDFRKLLFEITEYFV